MNALIMWDPDGAGPQREKLLVGGTYSFAGTVVARNLAMFDTSTGAWSALEGGPDGSVDALAILPTGELIVGGRSRLWGGQWTYGVFQHDGMSWSQLGNDIDNEVRALAILSNGEVVAGGRFSSAIRQWNGTTWTPLGAGLENPSGGNMTVHALTVLPNGDLVAGGMFEYAGTHPVNNIARWDGMFWSPLGAGFHFAVETLAALPNGDVIANGGYLVGGAIAEYAVRWNGGAWLALGTAFNGLIGDFAVRPNGHLIASGSFSSAGGVRAYRIASWNGNAWAPLGTGAGRFSYSSVRALAMLPDGDLAVGGEALNTVGSVIPASFARFSFGRRCQADMDCDDGVTIDDMLFYLDLYVANSSLADLDNGTSTGTPDGAVTVDDLLYFVAHYGVGC